MKKDELTRPLVLWSDGYSEDAYLPNPDHVNALEAYTTALEQRIKELKGEKTAIKHTVITAIKDCVDYEGKPPSELNYIQVIRNIVASLKYEMSENDRLEQKVYDFCEQLENLEAENERVEKATIESIIDYCHEAGHKEVEESLTEYLDKQDSLSSEEGEG